MSSPSRTEQARATASRAVPGSCQPSPPLPARAAPRPPTLSPKESPCWARARGGAVAAEASERAPPRGSCIHSARARWTPVACQPFSLCRAESPTPTSECGGSRATLPGAAPSNSLSDLASYPVSSATHRFGLRCHGSVVEDSRTCESANEPNAQPQGDDIWDLGVSQSVNHSNACSFTVSCSPTSRHTQPRPPAGPASIFVVRLYGQLVLSFQNSRGAQKASRTLL